jgi:P27 family predicted phage terminase small subunit
MPRPRKPESVKELSGTARPDRKIKVAPSGDRLLIEALKPPKILSRAARAEWKILAPRVAALGLLTTTTVRSFQLLCETLSTIHEAEALVAKNGFTIPTKDGGQKKNPAVSILEIARSQARQLFAEFGLTPPIEAICRYDGIATTFRKSICQVQPTCTGKLARVFSGPRRRAPEAPLRCQTLPITSPATSSR